MSEVNVVPAGPQHGAYPYSPNEPVVHIMTGVEMWVGGFPEPGILECRLPNLDIRRFFATEIMPKKMFIEQIGENKIIDYKEFLEKFK